MAVSYAIGCIIIGGHGNKCDLRITLLTCFLFSAASIYLTGGMSQDSVALTLIGIAGEGFWYSGQIVLAYVEVINVMQTWVETDHQARLQQLGKVSQP